MRTLMYAVRALQRECFGFRFHYPIEEVMEAGRADSLHYYVWSDRLFLDNMDFDGLGVPRKIYRRQGAQYNPLFIAWWGLHTLERYLRNGDKADLEKSLVQVRWLKANAVCRADGAVVWPCYFTWREGHCVLESGWISAMYQSVVISLLVRGYRVTGDKELLDLCLKGTRVFHQSIQEGGVRTFERGYVLYEEYPAFPLPRVLDGLIFSLLGLHDLAVQTRNSEVEALLKLGIEGLKASIGMWDYRGKWTWYGSHGYLCPPHYHTLNCLLLGILGRQTGDATLIDQAAQWNARNLSILSKVEVYVVFLLFKNLARLRLPSN
ncbi:MAG: D-glucuronyl C5-epimerase family protein [Nitrospira sp.]|nr:D-glucuronyl C5-epimerase family protein [Nitrospira sp.]